MMCLRTFKTLHGAATRTDVLDSNALEATSPTEVRASRAPVANKKPRRNEKMQPRDDQRSLREHLGSEEAGPRPPHAASCLSQNLSVFIMATGLRVEDSIFGVPKGSAPSGIAICPGYIRSVAPFLSPSFVPPSRAQPYHTPHSRLQPASTFLISASCTTVRRSTSHDYKRDAGEHSFIASCLRLSRHVFVRGANSLVLQSTIPSPASGQVPRFRPFTSPSHHVTKGRYITSNDPRGYM